ncbi:DUF1987 domain-containing protein [Paenibacillus sp. LMG 31456]|uniref:DUF1987 domain-containing protein n=1 Tax=Paenibacillus foliorum TaxID=2654974 RepID=A0A972GMG3_9BACL|nr:DUF1987 domain-containing protein [Paenibacillus foliorum]NOU92720.1 DUF1987 domain-containing protein [Paenibacillus foliorum]
MDILQIQGTKSTPEVIFDGTLHTLSVKGQSYPENSFKFYEPIFLWIDEYLQKLTTEEVHIHFTLPYINTSSSKCIMMLLEKFDQAHLDGKSLDLNWYYSADNESELECAEEFKEDMSLPFHILPLEKE